MSFIGAAQLSKCYWSGVCTANNVHISTCISIFFNICTALCLMTDGKFSQQKVIHITVIKCYRGTCATNKPNCFAEGSSFYISWINCEKKEKKRGLRLMWVCTRLKKSWQHGHRVFSFFILPFQNHCKVSNGNADYITNIWTIL